MATGENKPRPSTLATDTTYHNHSLPSIISDAGSQRDQNSHGAQPSLFRPRGEMALPNVRLVAGRFLSEHPALTLPKAGPQREQALPEAKRPYRKRPRPGDEETIIHLKEETLALKNSLNARNKELADLRTFWEPKHQEFLAMRAQHTRQSAHYTAISAEIKQLYEQINQQQSTINDLSTGLKNAILSTKDLSAALKVATASSTCQTGPADPTLA